MWIFQRQLKECVINLEVSFTLFLNEWIIKKVNCFYIKVKFAARAIID